MRFTTIRTAALTLALLLPATALHGQEAPAPAPEQVEPEANPSGEKPEPAADAAAAPRDPLEIYSDLNLFGQIFDRIRSEYVDAPDEEELIRAAIQGMLTSLDPHSGYLPPADYDEMREDTSGEFGGLGIEVTMEEGVIKVVSPIDDTPAARAGILTNDLIVEIDGVPVQGLTLDDAVAKMRGLIGTTTTITVVREGVTDPLEFDLTRAVIAMRAVRWSMEGDVALLRLSRFSEQAFVGIQNAIKSIYDERKGVAPKGIILDLRNNPGGLVDQSVYVTDAFLKQGAVVLTRGRIPEESARYDAQPDALDAQIADVPLVVLINGGSASASEIVAGALQDHKRATLVGTRSFGKGSVQSIISLGADGAMRLTTARYYTPNNRSIQALGITPDIEIKQVVPEEFQGRDEIIGEAGLTGHISSGNEEEASVGSSVYVPIEKADDTQLQYAIRLINGEETNPAFPPKAE
ncbi:S41 family peptidase [Devosia limi]|uniref:C-terminal processing peptidase-3. Serine peptidase. MEROPS family S41A n=1 Tax=Devosia limi DSM 17137 TaxID=1121477 RepID=A0A1M5G2H3_9HYPH|nr:S41 family peptidase [Devosia limi]SHF98027.1 C-terminal processing peptidase-3. Serine peptidase. MEROPS family S41A [Devosia limi DSM 17137]